MKPCTVAIPRFASSWSLRSAFFFFCFFFFQQLSSFRVASSFSDSFFKKGFPSIFWYTRCSDSFLPNPENTVSRKRYKGDATQRFRGGRVNQAAPRNQSSFAFSGAMFIIIRGSWEWALLLASIAMHPRLAASSCGVVSSRFAELGRIVLSIVSAGDSSSDGSAAGSHSGGSAPSAPSPIPGRCLSFSPPLSVILECRRLTRYEKDGLTLPSDSYHVLFAAFLFGKVSGVGCGRHFERVLRCVLATSGRPSREVDTELSE